MVRQKRDEREAATVYLCLLSFVPKILFYFHYCFNISCRKKKKKKDSYLKNNVFWGLYTFVYNFPGNIIFLILEESWGKWQSCFSVTFPAKDNFCRSVWALQFLENTKLSFTLLTILPTCWELALLLWRTQNAVCTILSDSGRATTAELGCISGTQLFHHLLGKAWDYDGQQNHPSLAGDSDGQQNISGSHH